MKTYRILAATVAAGVTLGLSACGDSKNPVGTDDKLDSESQTEVDGTGASSLDREGGGDDPTNPAGSTGIPDLTGDGLPVPDEPVRDEPVADEPAVTDEPVRDEPVSTADIATVADLIEQLEATGTTAVETGDVVDQPFFTPVGQVLKVAGQDVQVFMYETVEALKEEARRVGPDGYSIGTTTVVWVAPPRFYATGHVIVLYAGDDAAVMDALDAALGGPFAGPALELGPVNPLPTPGPVSGPVGLRRGP